MAGRGGYKGSIEVSKMSGCQCEKGRRDVGSATITPEEDV
jgi:hypothetical protein